MAKLQDEAVALDLGSMRSLDSHPHVIAPLARYHQINRELITKQQALYELDKQLSIALGRARDEMIHMSFESHCAIDAMGVSPLVSELQLQQRVLQQQIADIRPALAEVEYRLTIARGDARAQIRRQLAQEMVPALGELLQHLEAMVEPSTTITTLESHKQRLLLEAIDPTMWEQRLAERIKRVEQRLRSLTPPDEEA
jgi:hypothetical protein